MILEVKQWPESQEVMGKEDWFFISSSSYDKEQHAIIGNAAYARVLNEKEYILVEKPTADEFNEDYITAHDPGDEHMGKYLDIDKPTEKREAKRRQDNRRKSSRRKSAGDRRK